MKRILLIFLFILISTRILQQLYFRANIDRNQKREETQVNRRSTETKAQYFKDQSVEPAGFSSYCDIKYSDYCRVDCSEISSEDYRYDKPFFLQKRLILCVKNMLDGSENSFDVWKVVFRVIKSDVLSMIQARAAQVYHSSISNTIQGMTLGRLSTDSDVNSHLFKVTGTQHLLAISGFNVTFLASLIGRLYGNKLSKSSTIFFSICTICLYLTLASFSQGLLRAFIMFFTSSIATFIHRQSRALLTLYITFIFVIIIDIELLFSISFQLSAAATFGILLFSNIFNNYQEHFESLFGHLSRVKSTFFEYIVSSFVVSFVATIFVLPLVLYYFKEFSIVGIVVTTLVGWLVPIIFLFGLIFICFQFFISVQLLSLISFPLLFFASVFLSILRFFDNSQYLVSVSHFSFFHTVFSYMLILLFYLFILNIKRIKSSKKHAEIYHFFS